MQGWKHLLLLKEVQCLTSVRTRMSPGMINKAGEGAAEWLRKPREIIVNDEKHLLYGANPREPRLARSGIWVG